MKRIILFLIFLSPFLVEGQVITPVDLTPPSDRPHDALQKLNTNDANIKARLDSIVNAGLGSTTDAWKINGTTTLGQATIEIGNGLEFTQNGDPLVTFWSDFGVDFYAGAIFHGVGFQDYVSFTLGSDALGDMYYRLGVDGAGNLQRIPIGTAGQHLSVSGGVPAWVYGVTLPSAPGAGQDGQSIRWDNTGGAWEFYTSGGGEGSADWGNIGGTLADQTDLQGALDAKQDEITGLTASGSELNILDGATLSTAELNILDGVTATASELNALDGITATVTELNHTDGVTSNIQTQFGGKQPLDSDLTSIAGLSASNDDLLQRKSGVWTNRTLSQVRTDLALVAASITNGVTTSAPNQDQVFDALALKTTTALTASTGTAVAFDLPRLYGTDASPVTGNITMNSTGAIVGMVQTMIHNDSSEPTFGAEFHVSGTYTTGVDNLIMFLCTGTGDVWVTITKAD